MIKAAQHGERFLCDKNDNLVEKLTKTLSKAKKKKNLGCSDTPLDVPLQSLTLVRCQACLRWTTCPALATRPLFLIVLTPLWITVAPMKQLGSSAQIQLQVFILPVSGD